MKKNKLDYKRDFPQLISKLENMIIIGAFLPKERLVEANLAQKMEVSRAWVRDALKILETKGLVNMVPYRGAMVADLSEQEVNDIFQVRVVLERLCNKLAADNFQPEHKIILSGIARKIEQAYEDDLYDVMIELNTEFHEYITKIAHNVYLIETLKKIRSRYYIFNTFAWSNHEIVRKVLKEHKQYIVALETKDYELLSTLARSHISYSKDLYLNQVKRRKI
jgi:DNA-binding GntR family transcriptional regulator